MAEALWSDETRCSRFAKVLHWYAHDQIERRVLHGPNIQRLLGLLSDVPTPTPQEWHEQEEAFGHEIVGFIAAFLDHAHEDLHPFIHFGLTSSDLVEYDLHDAIYSHANMVAGMVDALCWRLRKMSRDYDIDRAGRTHGQTAEVTRLSHQVLVFRESLHRIQRDLLATPASVTKTPGPTGCQPKALYTTVPSNAVLSTQIVPRDILLRWASAMLNLSNALESLAMFVRLGSRSEIGEFREGAASDRQGSSAMPGKSNPIDSEKVCGLARVARGHFLAIAEVSALWEDRDLSNSSTERIAVPGLAATVEHMLVTMVRVITDLQIDTERIALNASNPRCFTNARQRQAQLTRQIGPIEASDVIKKEQHA